MLRLATSVCLLALSACASTEMAGYVGRPIEEVTLDYGPPINVVALADGRRGYQYRWGGGTAYVPGVATTSGTTIGGVTQATTTATPGYVINSEGCIITFIAGASGVVEETRPPRDLVC